MKRMKRSVLMLLFAFLVVAPQMVAAQDVVTLTLAAHSSYTDKWQETAEAIMAALPGIRIEVQEFVGPEYNDKVLTMIAAGSSPDLVLTWAQLKPMWIELGLLEDLTDRWYGSEVTARADVYPFMLDAASANGRIYGVPYDYNSTAWFLHLDLFAELGLEVPSTDWTVEEFRELARKLTDPVRGTYGANNQLIHADGHLMQWIYNWAGHDWLDETRTEVLLDQPAAIDAVQWWHENQVEYGIIPRPGSFPARADTLNGGYGMWQGWLSQTFLVSEANAYDWDVTVYPAGPYAQAAFAQGHMFSIIASSPNKEAAWRVIEWMASYEGQKEIVRINRRQPIAPHWDLWELYFAQLPPEKGQRMQQWLLTTLYADPRYVRNLSYWPSFPDMQVVMRTHIQNIFNRQQPPANELRMAAQKLRTILALER